MAGAAGRNDRGSIAIELMMIMPALIVVFLVLLQYAAKAHAERIAVGAAEEGLAAASAYDGTAEQGKAVANDYIERLGDGIENPAVSATRNGQTAEVTVTGEAIQLVPFLAVPIKVHVTGSVERLVDP